MVKDTQLHVQWMRFPFKSTEPAKAVGQNLRIVADQLSYNGCNPERSVATMVGVLQSNKCQFKPGES
jgi:hypothetical protein